MQLNSNETGKPSRGQRLLVGAQSSFKGQPVRWLAAVATVLALTAPALDLVAANHLAQVPLTSSLIGGILTLPAFGLLAYLVVERSISRAANDTEERRWERVRSHHVSVSIMGLLECSSALEQRYRLYSPSSDGDPVASPLPWPERARFLFDGEETLLFNDEGSPVIDRFRRDLLSCRILDEMPRVDVSHISNMLDALIDGRLSYLCERFPAVAEANGVLALQYYHWMGAARVARISSRGADFDDALRRFSVNDVGHKSNLEIVRGALWRLRSELVAAAVLRERLLGMYDILQSVRGPVPSPFIVTNTLDHLSLRPTRQSQEQG